MKRLKLVADKSVLESGEVFVYNRRVVEYSPSPQEEYWEDNLSRFYDFINPEVPPVK